MTANELQCIAEEARERGILIVMQPEGFELEAHSSIKRLVPYISVTQSNYPYTLMRNEMDRLEDT